MVQGNIHSCEFGDKNSEKTILLVGGSRLAHWEPLFSYIGRKEDFKVITATINGCSFGYHPNIENKIECQDWNNKIMNFISSLEPKPKVVVVNSSRSGPDGEYTPSGYIKNIKEVLSLKIPVIGIRINPEINDSGICLWRNSNDVSKCTTNTSLSLKSQNPVIDIKNKEGLKNFYPVDFTDTICSDGICPAAFDEYMAMRDDYHLTESYILYLAPALEKALDNQVGGFSRLLNN